MGFAYLLVSWGISSSLSFYIAAGTVLTISIVLIAIALAFNSSSKHQQLKRVKIKLATWISKTLIPKTSLEWTEYQDWLHVFLLARRQLLDRKCPKWKVAIITYWRLSAFLIIVSLSKIKSLAVSVMKLR